MADDGRPASLKLPPSAPKELDAFLGCTGTSVTLKGGKQAWVGKIDLGITTIEAPEISFAPGADGGIDLTVGSGMMSITLPAKVIEGKLTVEPPSIPGLADRLKQPLDDLNGWFAKNGKQLGAPKLANGSVTLTKVPRAAAAPVAQPGVKAGLPPLPPTPFPTATSLHTDILMHASTVDLPVVIPNSSSPNSALSTRVKVTIGLGVVAIIGAGAIYVLGNSARPLVGPPEGASGSAPASASTSAPTLAQVQGVDLTTSQQAALGVRSTTPYGTDFKTTASLNLGSNLLAAYQQGNFQFRHERDYLAVGVTSSNPDQWPTGKIGETFTAIDVFSTITDALKIRDASGTNLLAAGFKTYPVTSDWATSLPDPQDWLAYQLAQPGSPLLATNFIGTRGVMVIKISATCPGCPFGKIPPDELMYLKAELANLDAEFGVVVH